MEQKTISPGLTTTSQPDAQDIEKFVEDGVQTIINLRTSDEAGYWEDEARAIKDHGLDYAHIPISPQTLSDGDVALFSQAIGSVESMPAIVHCKSGGRAGLLTLLHLAVQNGWTLQETLETGDKIGASPAPDSPYRDFFEHYIRRHSAGERGE